MRDFRDAKTMATTLKNVLQDKVTLSHSECLEIVAQQFGLKNWNVLAAQIERAINAENTELTIPAGWLVAGTRAELYEVGVAGGTPLAVIRSRQPDEGLLYSGAYATLMQSVSAENYRGRRVVFAAELRTLEARGSAAIWLRVDKQPGQYIAFDNLEMRAVDGPLKGTQDWSKRRIVLDVAEEATSIHYGVLLQGSGTAWAGGIHFGEAGPDEPVSKSRPDLPKGPDNPDFGRSK